MRKPQLSKRRAAWHLYILECADGSLYTGITLDVEKRLAAHQSGKGSKYLRSRPPSRLVYREIFTAKSPALKREIEIKNWRRRQKLALIEKGPDHKN